MKTRHLLTILPALFILFPGIALAWECEVTLTAPKTIKIGQTIKLSASGTPTGGAYSWSRNALLAPSGSTARLTGYKPTYSEYIGVTSTYRSPKGKSCADTKWIWVCLCTVGISGPSQAKLGDPITLTANGIPANGIYIWTVNLGSGSISGAGETVAFTGDQPGEVEIKVAYTPPEGGEPCTYYHSILVNEECSVAIAGIFNRPVCRAESYSASALPDQGACDWVGSGITSSNGCAVTYGSTTPGFHDLTVTYSTPGGSTCVDTKSVLSYRLDAMTPKAMCYDTGSNLTLSDFNIFTTPAAGSFRDSITLKPTTVSTWQQEATVLVTGSFFCPDQDAGVNIPITVINKEVQKKASINLEIPNLLKTPLQTIGLAERLDFELTNTYGYYKECCPNGPADSLSGETSVNANIDVKDFTLVGVPLPKFLKQYVTLDAVNIGASGGGSVALAGENRGCSIDGTKWSGSGELSISANAGGKVKAIDPLRIIILEGALSGNTSLKEEITVQTTTATATGEWTGLSLQGRIVLKSKW
ncbi:MAG: hypothetical protein Q8J76_08450, partial [Desulfobulbaceae bacterium]|nr:hypothetical protein [Desulfobulbaceae bacterium]